VWIADASHFKRATRTTGVQFKTGCQELFINGQRIKNKEGWAEFGRVKSRENVNILVMDAIESLTDRIKENLGVNLIRKVSNRE